MSAPCVSLKFLTVLSRNNFERENKVKAGDRVMFCSRLLDTWSFHDV